MSALITRWTTVWWTTVWWTPSASAIGCLAIPRFFAMRISRITASGCFTARRRSRTGPRQRTEQLIRKLPRSKTTTAEAGHGWTLAGSRLSRFATLCVTLCHVQLETPRRNAARRASSSGFVVVPAGIEPATFRV